MPRPRRDSAASLGAIARLALAAAGLAPAAASAQDMKALEERAIRSDLEPRAIHPAPDGRRLAVVGGRIERKAGEDGDYGLFLIEEDGRARQVLKGDLKHPADWSPDSRKLAISSGPGYWIDNPLVIIDAETGAVEKTGIQGMSPDWSPDGRTIAVATEFSSEGGWFSGPPGGRIGIWDVEAKKLTPVAPAGYSLTDARTGRHIEGGTRAPSWSPDGRRIAFARWQYDSGLAEKMLDEVWVADRGGTEFRRAFDFRSSWGVTWSADSRFLIEPAGEAGPPRRVEVAALPAVGRDAWPGPPAEFVAAGAASEEAGRRAREADLSAVVPRNRAWLAPDFEGLESVQFLHKMEPKRLDERFAWRADGASLVEIARSEGKGAGELGRLWMTMPGGILHQFAPGAPYPWTGEQGEPERIEEARNRLMGTRTSFTALRWAREPDLYKRLAVRNDPEKGTITLELTPEPRKGRGATALNAGAMFATTSWAYIHDLQFFRSELTIDAADHRILREEDFGHDGKLICEIRFEDWLDIGSGRSVPRSIRMHFPGRKPEVDDRIHPAHRKFDVAYRFRWHPEGLWLLESGESRFEGEGEPQRESVVEVAINAPAPGLDAALRRAEDAAERLEAPPNVEAKERTLRMVPFALGGPPTPAIDPGAGFPSVRFALTADRNPLTAGLVAEIEPGETPDGYNQLLILADEAGSPVKADRIRLPRRGRIARQLGRGHELARTRYWILATPAGLGPAAGRPGPAGVAVRVRAIPYRLNEELIVQIPATPADPTPDPNRIPAKLRSIRFGMDDRGDLTARAELGNSSPGLGAKVTVVLLDAEDRPIAAASEEKHFLGRNDIRSNPDLDLTLNFGPADGPAPARALVGFHATFTHVLFSSTTFVVARSEPLFPIARMLASDDRSIRAVGIAALDRKIRDAAGSLRDRGGWEGDRKIEPIRLPRTRNALIPHRDRLAALLGATESPEEKAATCRLLGYGGRAGDAALLRPLLDDGDAQVREGAAIGLGLLHDPESAPRLEPFRKR